MADEQKPIEQVNPAGTANSELSEEELSMVSGGDEAPKETVTFEYGGLQVHYSQQKPG